MMTAEKKRPEKKSRRRDPDGGWNVPYLEHANVHAPLAARSYNLAIWSMIPFVGMVLGPLSVLLALVALGRGRSPDFRGRPLCAAAILLGGLVALTQWGGFLLVLGGLRGD